MRMVVKVDGQQQPLLLRCRNLRLIPATRAAPWLAKYSRSDLQHYEVRVGGDLESGRRAGSSEHREGCGESYRHFESGGPARQRGSQGVRHTCSRSSEIVRLSPSDTGRRGNQWPELACTAALEAFKSSYTCLLMSQKTRLSGHSPPSSYTMPGGGCFVRTALHGAPLDSTRSSSPSFGRLSRPSPNAARGCRTRSSTSGSQSA
mmetsp:Transcript_24363/g.80993  ORF Transcript_24363/g.80993 Transcript_24363/m.80993 type:complete len:204 (-) Transcript_24363:224-835(-)